MHEPRPGAIHWRGRAHRHKVVWPYRVIRPPAGRRSHLLREAVHPYAGVTMEWLNDIYLQQVGFPAEPGPDNDLLREALQKHIADLKPAAVSAFFNGKPYVAAEIADLARSEEHTSQLQSLMRISYAVFCLKKKKNKYNN